MPRLRLFGGTKTPAGHGGDEASAQRDLPAVGSLETRDEAEGGGLAAPARAEQREDLAPPDLERRPVDGRAAP